MKSLRSVFLALMLVLGLSSAASAQDIVVANATGFTIQQLGLIDSSASGDAQDLLGNDTLANGEALQISISGSSKGWELIATDGQGGQVNWQNLDLTGVSKITLHANGTSSNTPSAFNRTHTFLRKTMRPASLHRMVFYVLPPGDCPDGGGNQPVPWCRMGSVRAGMDVSREKSVSGWLCRPITMACRLTAAGPDIRQCPAGILRQMPAGHRA